MATYSYKLQMKHGGVPVHVKQSQFEAGDVLVFTCYDNGTTATLSGTATCNGSNRFNQSWTTTATVSGSTVSVAVTEEMTAIDGKVECEIVFSGGARTSNFIIDVETDPTLDKSEFNARMAELANGGIVECSESEYAKLTPTDGVYYLVYEEA